MTAAIDRPTTERDEHKGTLWLARAYAINWETILYVVIFLLAVFTRFYGLGDRVMSHDESLHTRYSYNLYADGNFQHTPLMHGPILFHMTALSYALFGDNDFTSRIYPAVLSVLVTLFPLLFRRWLGRAGALAASLMLLISPLLMYYGRYIRHDTPSIFFALVMAYCTFMYLDGPVGQRRRARWLYIFAGALLGNLGSKETSFIYIAIFGSALTLYWLVRLLQHLRGIPGKTWYYFITFSVLLAGLAGLGMYIVLAIAPPERAAQAAADAGGWLNSVDSTSLIVWTLLVIVAVLAFLVGTLLWAFRGSRARVRWLDVVIVIALALAVITALVAAEEVSRLPSRDATQHVAPVVPGQDGAEAESGVNMLPYVLWWVIGALAVLALLVSWRLGWWRALHRFPELDVLIVMGTLILPWLTPLIITASGVSAVDYTPQGITRGVLVLIPAFAISITMGLIWNWKRWLVVAVVFHALFAFFFTTMFTNVNGLASGMIGSLGYWLDQQGVRRGSQPQYYYLAIIMPVYEFLPVIGSALAALSGAVLFWRYRRVRLEERLDAAEAALLASADAVATAPEPDEGQRSVADLLADPPPDSFAPEGEFEGAPAGGYEQKLKRGDAAWLGAPSFIAFVAWWAIFNLIAYTLAGEKMPWLGTHMTVPLILLSGWYFGRVFERIEGEKFRRGGWLYLLLLPVLLIALFQVLSPFLLGRGPLPGLQQEQLAQTGQWLAVVAASGIIVVLLYQLVERTGWRHFRQMLVVSAFALLAVLTARAAWMASFINYDYATEYLVYAHAAPAVKQVLAELESISRRTTDGLSLNFAYDNETSWPYSWYFRHFPNASYFGSSPSRPVIDNAAAVVVGEANRAAVEPLLEDRFYHMNYIRMWWPMQDYYNLTPERINSALDFSPDNPVAAQLRQGLFDIWWSRDYQAYGEAVGRSFALTQWPLADRMHFYVRKDIAAQIWDLGVGEGTVANPLDNLEVNVCNANWELRSAELIIGAQGAGPGQLARPVGLAVAADGTLFAAEEINSRVSVFDASGQPVAQFSSGAQGEALFMRPNDVALGPDGRLYIADTWNYRVVVLSPEGELLTTWGERGEYGQGALADPVYGLWGPRAVVVDAAGSVYVADTGNKRVRVYTSDGVFVRDIGVGGAGPGQLDEPAGLALHPDGRLFVADTWNRRVSVFNTEGLFLYTFDVRGWYDELGNRPYLAVDPERDLVYVTDPDAGRVLVYDTAGSCLGSFGQVSREGPNSTQFATVGGVAVGPDGSVFVADAGTGRVLRFAPWTAEPPGVDFGAGELTAEVTAEATAEVTQAADDQGAPAATAEPGLEATPEADATAEAAG